MPKEDENLIQKLTGMLIQVLHGEYTDTRELAVVQLVLLGDKSVPYICSYLEREAEMENDLITHHKLHIEHHRNEKDYEAARVLNQFREDFQKKWGWQAQDEHIQELDNHGGNRRYAIEGALRALSLIGDKKAIPVLIKLPIVDYTDQKEPPIFEKTKDTIAVLKKSNEPKLPRERSHCL